jgi:hypothetical protein
MARVEHLDGKPVANSDSFIGIFAACASVREGMASRRSDRFAYHLSRYVLSQYVEPQVPDKYGDFCW